MKYFGKCKKKVDYVFWISFLFMTNPGGILKALGEDSGSGGANVTDLLFVILLGCFVYIHVIGEVYYDKVFKKILNFLTVFFLYYILVYCIIVPIFKNNLDYNIIFTFIKSRHGIINLILVPAVYQFYLRSYLMFYKMFFFISIIVLGLFLFSIVIGIDILPVARWDRRFIDTKRLILSNYGLMPYLIPFGIVFFVFKFRVGKSWIIGLGFILMYMTWLLSLFRRHIFGMFIYVILAVMMNNYFRKKPIVSIKKLASITGYIVIIALVIQFIFPRYIEAGIAAGKETYNVIKYGETSIGKEDVRLGLGKEFMQNQIKKNYIVGTGFDNRWRTKVGDRAGFESSDYPFLGAIAMVGIVGLLLFTPIYIILIRCLFFDFKFFRQFGFNSKSPQSFLLIAFILFFVYDLILYMNLYLPISVIEDKKWYVFMAMYFASRNIFYTENKENKSIIQNINQ